MKTYKTRIILEIYEGDGVFNDEGEALKVSRQIDTFDTEYPDDFFSMSIPEHDILIANIKAQMAMGIDEAIVWFEETRENARKMQNEKSNQR